jgi:hypothetical protein
MNWQVDGGIAPPFVTSAHPCRFTPGKTSSNTYCVSSWLVFSASLDTMEMRNILSLPEDEPWFMSNIAHKLVAVLTESSQLPLVAVECKQNLRTDID